MTPKNALSTICMTSSMIFSSISFSGCGTGLPEPTFGSTSKPTSQKQTFQTDTPDSKVTSQTTWVDGPTGGQPNTLRIKLEDQDGRSDFESLRIQDREYPLETHLRLYTETTCCKKVRSEKVLSVGGGVYEFSGEFLLAMPQSRVWIVLEDANEEEILVLYDEVIDVP